ncbi:MAG: YkvA family protein [Deinococcota bacterium]
MAVFWKKQPPKHNDAEASNAQPVAVSALEQAEAATTSTSPHRWRFGWFKRSSKTSASTSTNTLSQDQTGAEIASTPAQTPAQTPPKWQVWRRSKRVSEDVSDDVSLASAEDKDDVSPKRHWWRRKRPRPVTPDELDVYAAAEYQADVYDANAYVEPEIPVGARPLNPDGSLPPDLKAKFEAHDAPRDTQRVFNRFLQRVETKSPEELEQTAAEVDGKLGRMNRGSLAKVWQKVETLARVVRDPKSHWPSKLMALASLVYVVSPVDAIPDILPALGLADDVAVVITVVGYLAQAVDYAKKVPKELEQQTDREIQKHIHKNRISLVYAAAAAVLVFLAAWAINTFAS